MPLSFSWTTLVDGNDWPKATQVNSIATAVAAIIAALGGAPEGTAASVQARLAHSLDPKGYLNFDNSTELTISAGAVTPVQNYHRLDTQADAASDDLDTVVSSGLTGAFALFVRAEHTSRTIVIKHGTGNILSGSGSDIDLDETYKYAILLYDSVLSKWLAFAGGGGTTAWGTITGTISSQTDLRAKTNTIRSQVFN